MNEKSGTGLTEEETREKTWIKQELREMDTDEDNPIEDRKELVEALFEKAEAYVKTSIEIFKLKSADKMAEVMASLVSRLVVILFLSFFFLMINIGIALWLGESMGHIYYGFYIVSGLYAIIALCLFVFRDPIIKNPIINSIISQVLK
ncbi:MAG: hypothetical protein ABJB16_08545 [Saprospiraceae bacterium]